MIDVTVAVIADMSVLAGILQQQGDRELAGSTICVAVSIVWTELGKSL